MDVQKTNGNVQVWCRNRAFFLASFNVAGSLRSGGEHEKVRSIAVTKRMRENIILFHALNFYSFYVHILLISLPLSNSMILYHGYVFN